MKAQWYIILAVIFAVLIAIFAVINVDSVQVDYLFGTGSAPLILIILFSVLMGVLITASVGGLRMFKLNREVRALRKDSDKKAAEITELQEKRAEQGQEELERPTTNISDPTTNTYPTSERIRDEYRQ
ncbi:lipopolysaccharide assembly LapA domain-containing protein [Terribacillus sp. AE2B 122]|uniref:LapA family protein n=1 Tax=Terribacillus sp. AE2B 122 TaxID=1331902 RepID=UPI001583561C|nr:lipopolysaccharide assembly LapA domain-containing protein [Terribacillus sp. AE2B 122]